ncbi:MAG: type II toxin-antitoxin system PemK/MazF family toxin [Candidatus Altiarchaeales archaeon HGW-Altiarchaeales-1]|nr:MAG: type II toxin-antitoxin system PemK/MazF family toxin [Candidatus Altiarchaeales archaeon HGW-Altiarchaeales-2]PKP59668.1 MAG: type II toxin-antitoxin system PemK/MazF family toxin [Candidatus Altiarchaeales archaeon HGW-Altiarchaeales-1]
MKKGAIVLVEIPASGGHEQVGMRPAIVLSEVDAEIVIIIPFTSNVQALRFLHTIDVKPSIKNGLNSRSIALVFQMRAIDKKKIKNIVGVLEDETMEKINEMIKEMLHL